MHIITSSEAADHAAIDIPLQQRDTYFRVLAWEIGLHEMFWDVIDIGEAVAHPTLGRGAIKGKKVRDIAREGHAAKLIRINLDCGQNCIFHSRVENNEKVSEGLGKDVERALGG